MTRTLHVLQSSKKDLDQSCVSCDISFLEHGVSVVSGFQMKNIKVPWVIQNLYESVYEHEFMYAYTGTGGVTIVVPLSCIQ